MVGHPHDQERCRDLLAQLNDYVDCVLADDLCHALEAHLDGCADCRRVLDSLARTIALYHRLGEEPAKLPPDIERRLLDRLGVV
jgi:predicted anti-sigma-YlaC factor YlaD